MRIRIEKAACVGNARCHAVDPDIYPLDDDGYIDSSGFDVAPASELQIPGNLGDAVAALQADSAMREGFGSDFLRYYSRINAALHLDD